MTERRRPAVIFALVASALAVAGLAWHLTAVSIYYGTIGGRSLVARVNSAEYALGMEPWNSHFRWRLVTLKAEALAEQGKIDEAFWLLQPFAQTVRNDPLYRETYQRIVSIKAPLDARKAHVQHGKEKAGGALDPEDVQR